MKQKAHGFTIVELLIVIVVVAILASITIVAYNGVQQRANNTAIINAASQSLRMIQAYVAANGVYPYAGGDACVTTVSGCTDENGNTKSSSSTLTTNMATIGVLPASVPSVGASGFGVWFTYNTSQTLGGVTQPLRLTYMLVGINQSCGLNNVVQFTWPNFTLSTTGYTSGNISNSGKTLCWVSVPGPSA